MKIEWRIDDALWLRMRRMPAQERRIRAIIRRLEDDLQNLRFVGRGYLGDNKAKARFDRAYRLPVLVEAVPNQDVRRVYLFDIVNHHEGVELHREEGAPLDTALRDWVTYGPEAALEPVEQAHAAGDFGAYRFRWLDGDDAVLARIDEVDDCDLDWSLSDEQLALVRQPGPLLLCGSAGSGKSTIAVSRMVLLNRAEPRRTLYLTYSETLRDSARKLWLARAATIPDLDPDLVDFETVETYCRRLVGADDAARLFPPQHRCSMADAPLFTSYERAHITAFWPRQTAWEELRSVIKGGCTLSGEPTGTARIGLSREAYLQLPENRVGRVSPSLLPSDERLAFYESIFRPYAEQLRAVRNRAARWDDMDLARAALERLEAQLAAAANRPGQDKAQPRYDLVFLDEVQDLAPVQIALAILSCASAAGFFAAGDMQQSVQPANFDFGRLGTLMHERGWHLTARDAHGGGWLRKLNQNFRSRGRIVELGNRVTLERNRLLHEHYTRLDATHEGGHVAYVSHREIGSLAVSGGLAASLMIIAEEQHRDEAQAFFRTRTVLSLEQAKGLERKSVVLWRLFESGALVHGPWSDASEEAANRLRHQLSCLTVGMSRARETLIFVDDAFPAGWSPFEQFAFGPAAASVALLQEAMHEVSAAEDYRTTGEEDEAKGNFVQAAEWFERAGMVRDQARCLALDAVARGDDSEAATHFETAGFIDRADRHLVACQDPERRLAFWVRWASEPGRPSWEALLDACGAEGVQWAVFDRLLDHLSNGSEEARATALSLSCAALTGGLDASQPLVTRRPNRHGVVARLRESQASILAWSSPARKERS